MTGAPRMIEDMTARAKQLKGQAAGYRFAGERRLARSAQNAADLLLDACAALIGLAAMEKDLKE